MYQREPIRAEGTKETIRISSTNMCFCETEEIKGMRCYCIREESYSELTNLMNSNQPQSKEYFYTEIQEKLTKEATMQ